MHQAVIQFTAFLMTLRKKGLLPPDAWKWAYFGMLASVRYRVVSRAIVSTASFEVGRGCPRLVVTLLSTFEYTAALGQAADFVNFVTSQVGVSMTRAVSGSELARISAVSLAFAAARLYVGVPKYVAMAAVTALAVCERAVGF